MASEVQLSVQELSSYYGTTKIIDGVTLKIEKGSPCGLVGRIGAGKTTLFRSILGSKVRTEGSIKYEEEEISQLSPNETARSGIGYIPGKSGIFTELTVEENLEVSKSGMGGSIEMAYDLFPELQDRKSQQAKTLSGGEQQMLAIAQTLLTKPDFLLLDEIYEGLAGKIIKRIDNGFEKWIKKGISNFLQAESTLKNCRLVSDRIFVMDRGQIIFEGNMEEVEEFARKRGLPI